MKYLVLALSMIFVVRVFAVSKYEVRVAEVSTVRVGDAIRLGVIANTEIADADLADRLGNLIVLPAIDSETTREIDSQQIAIALREKLSFQDLQRVSVTVPEKVKIKAKYNYFYERDLRSQIAKKALSFCSGCEVVFEDFKINDIPMKEEVLSYRLDTSNFRQAGAFVLPLVLETSKGKTSIWVQGKASLYKEAPVAKRMIRIGDRLALEDFEFKRVNVSFAKDGTSTTESMIGKLSQRVISAGQVIYANDIRREPAAHRGQIVKIILGDSTFEVSAQATAEEAGGIGEVIKVKTMDTKKLMSGTLVDLGVVKIE